MPTYSSDSWNYSAAECADNAPNGVPNLLSLYGRATTDDIRKGWRWYGDAYQDAQRISKEYDLPIETVVKVACALSPKMPWEKNMQAAEECIRYYASGGFVPDIQQYESGAAYIAHNGKTNRNKPALADDPRLPSLSTGGLRMNLVKALWILQGHDWVLRGPKVAAFLDNILNYQTSEDVTVDSHAIQCWFGTTTPGTYGVTPAWHRLIRADYIEAARRVGIPALVLQAILWIAKKRLAKKGGK